MLNYSIQEKIVYVIVSMTATFSAWMIFRSVFAELLAKAFLARGRVKQAMWFRKKAKIAKDCSNCSSRI